MAIIVIVLLLAAMLGYPYWSAAILRTRMLRRLKRTCREMGFRLRPLRSNLFFLRNRADSYDLLIEGRDRIYAVKLWSAYRRDGTLLITRDGRVRERRQAPVVLDVRRDARGARSEGRAFPVRRTRLALSPKEKRTVTRLLLVYPAYRSIVRQTETGEIPLRCGDDFLDKMLITPIALEKRLRENSVEGEGKIESKDVSCKTMTLDA